MEINITTEYTERFVVEPVDAGSDGGRPPNNPAPRTTTRLMRWRIALGLLGVPLTVVRGEQNS